MAITDYYASYHSTCDSPTPCISPGIPHEHHLQGVQLPVALGGGTALLLLAGIAAEEHVHAALHTQRDQDKPLHH
jgi:hypothetical protein